VSIIISKKQHRHKFVFSTCQLQFIPQTTMISSNIVIQKQ